MSADKHGLNTITIADKEYLLAGGDKAHLVAEASDATAARAALLPWRFERDAPWQQAYELLDLQTARWSHKTLCGREWREMEPGDGPGFVTWSQPVHGPSCKSCLRIVGRDLASRAPDDRIPFVASLAVQEVVELSSSRIDGVPGDQAEALRVALRNELRRRGLRGRTHVHGSIVFVVSDDAWGVLPQSRRDALDQEAAEVISSAIFDAYINPPRRGIHWDTWRAP